MQREEYKFVFERLKSLKDLEDLHKKAGYSKDMLYNILGRKIVNKVLKNFHKLKNKQESLYKQWLKGNSIPKLSLKYDFPAALLASFVLQQDGFNKKEIRGMLTHPEKVKDVSLRAELKKVVSMDFIYSPWANTIQAGNGEKGEEKIEVWLKKKKYSFMTQDDIIKEGIHQKTPDFLFRKPVNVKGLKVRWIESKASFGDDAEIKKNYKKQLKPYTELFGPGIVVYWYDYIDDIHVDDDVYIVNAGFFK